MSRLTDEDLLQIQTFIDRGRRTLEHQGLSIEIDNDLRKWVKLARRAPGAIGAMSTHDPERCHIHPGNAFWVNVCSPQGILNAAHRAIPDFFWLMFDPARFRIMLRKFAITFFDYLEVLVNE